MTHFVAFTRGEKTGARVAFHTVPVLTNGEYVQPLASVGTQMRRGDSAGCIRVLPEQGQVIWDWLQKGDEVTGASPDHGSISSSPPRRYVWPSTHSLRYGHHRHDTPGFLTATSPSICSWISRWMPSSVRRSAVRSTPSVTSSTIGCGRVEVEGGQLARRHIADERFDQRVEPQILAVTLADPARLQVDDHLPALATAAGGP